MRKVFLDNLIKYEGNKNINWEKNIGKSIYFIYDTTEGNIEIINYTKKENKLKIKYNNITTDILTGNFTKCLFGRKLKLYSYSGNFKVELKTKFKTKSKILL